MKRVVKTGLLLICLLFAAVNYYAFIQISKEALGATDIYLKSIGYYFGVSTIFNLVMTWMLPPLALLGYVHVSSRKEFFKAINKLYSVVSVPVLLVLLFLLPTLLFIQNWFYGKWLKSPQPSNK